MSIPAKYNPIVGKPKIEVDQKLFSVCRTYGKDSLNAVAVVLSHELAHYYSDHTFCSDYAYAYLKPIESKALVITENNTTAPIPSTTSSTPLSTNPLVEILIENDGDILKKESIGNNSLVIGRQGSNLVIKNRGEIFNGGSSLDSSTAIVLDGDTTHKYFIMGIKDSNTLFARKLNIQTNELISIEIPTSEFSKYKFDITAITNRGLYKQLNEELDAKSINAATTIVPTQVANTVTMPELSSNDKIIILNEDNDEVEVTYMSSNGDNLIVNLNDETKSISVTRFVRKSTSSENAPVEDIPVENAPTVTTVSEETLEKAYNSVNKISEEFMNGSMGDDRLVTELQELNESLGLSKEKLNDLYNHIVNRKTYSNRQDVECYF
jgi:hypothetical protein